MYIIYNFLAYELVEQYIYIDSYVFIRTRYGKLQIPFCVNDTYRQNQYQSQHNTLLRRILILPIHLKKSD
jgi:hypothetical protein